ncbi:MAG: hypothetical protein K2Q21_10060 [Chitinophagaceae bacterium]|nr:hypothetical protein [Chitinophagaceae bacterium]
MKSEIAKTHKSDFVNIFLEIRIELSFKARFLFCYINELNEEKIIEQTGMSYSREIFYQSKSIDFICMLFVYNKHFVEDQVAEIRLLQDNQIIVNKIFHLSNSLPYDGWFILEKKISPLRN